MSKFLPTSRSTKENGRITNLMGKESWFTKMAMFTKASAKMERLTATVSLCKLMAHTMRENGKTICRMVLAKRLQIVVVNTRDSTKME